MIFIWCPISSAALYVYVGFSPYLLPLYSFTTQVLFYPVHPSSSRTTTFPSFNWPPLVCNFCFSALFYSLSMFQLFSTILCIQLSVHWNRGSYGFYTFHCPVLGYIFSLVHFVQIFLNLSHIYLLATMFYYHMWPLVLLVCIDALFNSLDVSNFLNTKYFLFAAFIPVFTSMLVWWFLLIRASRYGTDNITGRSFVRRTFKYFTNFIGYILFIKLLTYIKLVTRSIFLK